MGVDRCVALCCVVLLMLFCAQRLADYSDAVLPVHLLSRFSVFSLSGCAVLFPLSFACPESI